MRMEKTQYFKVKAKKSINLGNNPVLIKGKTYTVSRYTEDEKEDPIESLRWCIYTELYNHWEVYKGDVRNESNFGEICMGDLEAITKVTTKVKRWS